MTDADADADAAVTLRPAAPADLPALAALWHAGWHEAHAAIVPAALTAARTPEDIATRARRHLSRATVAVTAGGGGLLGFVMVRDDELYQLYTAPAARGTGLASTLMTEGERQLAAAGVARAHLACGIGNTRAARFYEKAGWTLARTETDRLEVPSGHFELEIWRFEKTLAPGA